MNPTTPDYPDGGSTEGDLPATGGVPPTAGGSEMAGGAATTTREVVRPLHLEAGLEPVPGYPLVRVLGRGGFGEVWEALAPGGVRVALKFIRLDTKAAGLEQRGLEVIRNIRHPHLVDVQFAVPVADCLVIAMPLCEQSLHDRFRACRAQGLPGISREELLGYMDDVAQAIDFLNEPRHPSGDGGLVGVQHRDIKPHNIFLVGGSARVADFGLAKILEATAAVHTGCMSPHYVAPEALDGRVTKATDQYSVAVTYYQLQTGKLPFVGDSIHQILHGHVHLAPDLTSLPEAERPIVGRALAKQPEDRWPSCREFVRQLREATAPQPLPAAAGTTVPAPPTRGPDPDFAPLFDVSAKAPPRRSPLAALLLVGLAALLLVGVSVVIYFVRSEGSTEVRKDMSTGGTVFEVVKSTSKAVIPPPAPTAPAVKAADVPAVPPAPPREPEKAAPPPREVAAVLPATAGVAARAEGVFRAHCLDCHGGRKVKGKVKILDRDLLVQKEKVVPGQPDESELFLLVTAEDESVMPPIEEPRLKPEEIDAIRAWIAEGAPAFPTSVTPPAEAPKAEPPATVAGAEDVLKAILRDVRALPAEDRPFARYFSLNHLLVGGAGAAELDLHRDALAKAINHLSWEREVVRPEPIEPSKTVYRVDLRALGWDRKPYQRMDGPDVKGPSPLNLFDLALLEYPYGVAREGSETFDPVAREFLGVAGQVRAVPYVHADWFVSTATLPPLYEDFLQMPFELKALEDRLGVDAQADIASGRAKRAGMTVSDVSRNNRVVERHPSTYGAYWKSLDFRTSKAAENLFLDPLNLKPSGGEVVFNLPNGLQGYFLTDAVGNRLEAAPTEIVTDRFAEDKVVRNGLSCIRCHDLGMKDFVDVVHAAVERLPGSPGFDRQQVLRLYPGQPALDPLVKEDRVRFLAALERALGKRPGGEPLIAVTQRFLDAPLPLSAVAAELETSTAADLRPIFGTPPFTRLGLAALASDGSVRRDTWEDSYDRVVRNLGSGLPIVPLDALSRRDVRPSAAEFDVTLATNKKNHVFAPGDTMFITVTNPTTKALHIELIGTSDRGGKVILAPSSTVIEPGQSFRFPSEGAIRIRDRLGKEQITVFASDAPFPAGELLRGKDVVDRVVHPFEGGRQPEAGGFDPARVLKKTIDIETR